MKNIELKVKVKNFSKIVSLLKMRGKYTGLLHQTDTYYFCRNGRVKIREINNTNFELIYYQRPNTALSKLSVYQVMPIGKRQMQPTKQLYASVFGEKKVIVKKRQLWVIGTTRIHLDRVKGLGSFLELETVLKGGNLKKSLIEHRNVVSMLQLDGYKKIRKSYSDL